MPNRYFTSASILVLLSWPAPGHGQALTRGQTVRITDAVEVLPSGELGDHRGSFEGRLVSAEGGVVELLVEDAGLSGSRRFALGGRSQVAVGEPLDRIRELSILGGLMGFAVGFHRATDSKEYRDGWIFSAEEEMAIDGVGGGLRGLLVGSIVGAVVGSALTGTEWVSLRPNGVGFHIR